jgi:hypothetical protein
MDDPAENLRLSNLVKVPAVLVRHGNAPGDEVYRMISNPVRIPVRIERRQTGAVQSRATSSAPGSRSSQG